MGVALSGCGTNNCTIDVEHERAVPAAVMDVSAPLWEWSWSRWI